MTPIAGPSLPPSDGPDLSWVDPVALARAQVSVRKGLYPDVAAYLNHAVRSYLKIKGAPSHEHAVPSPLP